MAVKKASKIAKTTDPGRGAPQQAAADRSVVSGYDLLVLGTPVNGGQLARAAMPYINALPQYSGKKSIVFCTCAMFKGSTFKVL
jgi:hypothetical protein